ncbi:Aste57867_23071 [Aphanomyces stellatus]|uniref:Aste57867_23071 protein n=1 Tax=Aphanomyces stellatus TaxID=120398 RepID=A0A485LLR6_9STRA|nr:hypothetical protein As57867_023000 [Aphanomyces stellatus]VFT99719.1 Aste57867_23071 [Aphanomyces stellatus]
MSVKLAKVYVTTKVLPPPQKQNNAFEVASGVWWTYFQRHLDHGGSVYILATVGLSFFSLSLIALYMENNLFWPAFLASGMQHSLIDLFNSRLAFVNETATLDVFQPSMVTLDQVYTVPQLSHALYATYPRRLLYGDLPSALAVAVRSLRTLKGKEVTSMIAPYCWVNLLRTWELAHSAARQARCVVDDADNAGVYLEPVLRNIDFASWSQQYGTVFHATIGDAVVESGSSGQAWLAAVTQHTWLAVDDEVAVWSDHGLTRFALQWANCRQLGIQETIVVQNALGATTAMQIKAITPTALGSMWTSGTLYGALETDMWAMVGNASLVRQGSTFFGIDNPNMIEMYLVAYPLGPLAQYIHDTIGVFGNFDLKLISPPASLLALVDRLQGQILGQLQTNSAFATAFDAIGTLALNPTPLRWQDPKFVFYGGNLMCFSSGPKPYVQQSFGFDDSCNAQQQYVHTWTGYNLLFAMLVLDLNDTMVTQACTQCPSLQVGACRNMADAARQAIQTFPNTATPRDAMARDVRGLNLAVMQYVQNGSNLFIDTQLIVDDSSDPFAVFGWTAMYEWAMGYREAVAFAGDFQTLRLLSYQYNPVAQLANPLDVQQTLAYYLETISASVSSGLAVAAALVVLVQLVSPPRRVGVNWFVFNRVASTSWLGRPMLVVRGITALLCLATCPVRLETHSIDLRHTATGLAYETRSVWTSMLLSGEGLWLTYVVNDLLFHLTHPYTRIYAPYSSALAWLVSTAIDVALPLPFQATIARSCTLFKMDTQLNCTAATLRIGHASRLALLCSVQLGAVVVSAIVCKLSLTTRSTHRRHPTLLLPGAAMAFVTQSDPKSGYWSLDAVSGAMCGMFLIKFRRKKYILDVNLWLVLSANEYDFWAHRNAILIPHVARPTHGVASIDSNVSPLPPPPAHGQVSESSISSACDKTPPHAKQPVSAAHVQGDPTPTETASRIERMADVAWIVAGFVHIVLSLVTNVTFIAVTVAAALANDFFWADFTPMGTQTFLVNAFNRQLLTTRSEANFSLDVPSLADVTQFYNTTASSIAFSAIEARQELFAANPDLGLVVANLRRMDSCKLPWMFTQYCWLDFNQTWTMASTTTRQERCEAMDRGNGAVYLESALRNMRSWSTWAQCWGTSFDIGIAQALQTTSRGNQWLACTTTAASTTSIPNEVLYWQSQHITTFVLQWQNYKSVGLYDSIRIQNVFNSQFPVTLSAVDGKFHLSQQTSLKMYWSLAGDLWAIGSNATSVSGMSLLRTSATFAFQNMSAESLLQRNGTLASPLTAGFEAFQTTVGPFGAVDMKFVLAPASLQQMYQAMVANITALVVDDTKAQADFEGLASRSYIGEFPPPLASSSISLLGGNLFCGGEMAPLPFTIPFNTAMYVGFSHATMCGIYDTDYFIPDKFLELFALLGVNQSQPVTTDAIDAFCAYDTYVDAPCVDVYTAKAAFLTKYFASTFATVAPLATQVQVDVVANRVEYVQYILNGSTTALFHLSILDPNSGSLAWPFFGWCFLYGWAAGLREVVSFQGDQGTLTVVSARSSPLTMTPNASEIPRDLSFLLQVAIVYITALFLVLAALVALYTLTSRGNIKGRNLFKFSRLVGLVWVGRTFLLVRSITAVIMLDTASLDLVQRGGMTRLVTPPIQWFNMMLASMELQWFVYILNDALSFVTRYRTAQYAGLSAWTAWFALVLWTFVQPNRHTAAIHRTCVATDMDVALTCISGSVSIGQFSRLCISAAICGASVIMCYGVALLAWQDNSPVDVSSLMLSSQAKYLLNLSQWTFSDVTYLDKPTALMAGIVSLEWHTTLYLFDIKKWRIVVTKRPPMDPSSVPAHIRHAIPLVE